MRLANEAIAAEVLPERGMTIAALHTLAGPNVLWERPGHVAPPCSRELGPAGSPSIDTLHDLLVGGWFEMSPHAGLPGTLDGRPTRLHGEAMRLPWELVDAGETWVEAEVATVDGALELTRRVELDGARLTVVSAIRNAGAEPASITHGEHPCFRRMLFGGGTLTLAARSAAVLPLLDPANATLAAGQFAWPHAPTRDGGTADLSSIPEHADGTHDHVAIELAEPRVELVAPGGPRVTIEVDLDRHPHLLLWRNHRAPGEPGRGAWDVLALEPMSAPGMAVDDAVRAGAVQRLAPGERAVRTVAVSLA
ncbi:MAG TPA: DUF4432 family protein [Conexibacter sp.]|nr:DUF4432 family protein [Conexibacter sp.]